MTALLLLQHPGQRPSTQRLTDFSSCSHRDIDCTWQHNSGVNKGAMSHENAHKRSEEKQSSVPKQELYIKKADLTEVNKII